MNEQCVRVFPYPQRRTHGDALPRRQTTQTSTPSPLEVSGATGKTEHMPTFDTYFTISGSSNHHSKAVKCTPGGVLYSKELMGQTSQDQLQSEDAANMSICVKYWIIIFNRLQILTFSSCLVADVNPDEGLNSILSFIVSINSNIQVLIVISK